jgi:tetratricopeptide (TPR) repeat protein
VAAIRCSFRGGEVITELKRIPFSGLEGLKAGNSWRGAAVLLGIILLVQGFFSPGILILAAVGLWSFVHMAGKYWRIIYRRAKAQRLLKRGQWEEALPWAEPVTAGSNSWWQFVGAYCAAGHWDLARRWLEELEPGEERDFLLAVTYLALKQPGAALEYCPPRPQGRWQTVAAEASFQQGEWARVVTGLRAAGSGDEKIEHAWLRGASYYFLKEYKSAVKLLRQVVRLGGNDYGNAGQLLEQASAHL